MPPSVAIVVPARYHSTRFPGKPLAMISGRPLIEWVYRRALEIEGADRVIVATDDERIAGAVRRVGGNVVMTSEGHATGTDRVAEVARDATDDLIFNLQGDEPIFSTELVQEMIVKLSRSSTLDIVTAAHAILSAEELENPNVVKVVMDRAGRALYFSRAPIPYMRSGVDEEQRGWRHIGIYGFRRESLLRFSALPQTPLEQRECLEQLRAIENGMVIGVVKTDAVTIGVDVPQDIKTVEKVLSPS